MIVKVCIHHGDLTIDQVRYNSLNRAICKVCNNEHVKQHKIRNKKQLNEKALRLRELASKNLLKKTCQVHGELNSSDIYVNNKAVKNCKICIETRRKESYLKGKSLRPPSDKAIKGQLKKQGACIKHGENMRNASGLCRKCSAIASDRWKKRNPEKAKHFTETMIERSRLPERIERRKQQEKLRRKNLTDYYVKSILKSKNDKGLQIPKDLIDIKKVVIQIKRIIKKKQDAGNEMST